MAADDDERDPYTFEMDEMWARYALEPGGRPSLRTFSLVLGRDHPDADRRVWQLDGVELWRYPPREPSCPA